MQITAQSARTDSILAVPNACSTPLLATVLLTAKLSRIDVILVTLATLISDILTLVCLFRPSPIAKHTLKMVTRVRLAALDTTRMELLAVKSLPISLTVFHTMGPPILALLVHLDIW